VELSFSEISENESKTKFELNEENFFFIPLAPPGVSVILDDWTVKQHPT